MFKDPYPCPIEIIKGLTDEEQFQYLTKLKGPQVGKLPVYNTISFTKIKINTLSETTRVIWKVLSMVFYLRNPFTNPIMFGIILKRHPPSLL